MVLTAGIGDLVLASRSVKALRKGYPDAELHLLTSTDGAAIAQNYGYLDHVWTFPIRELRNNKAYLFAILKLIRSLRKIDFNLAVNLYRIYSRKGAFRMGLLFLILKAQVKIGHGHKGFGFFSDRKIGVHVFQNRHFADAMLEIARVAGGIPDEKGIEVFFTEETVTKWGKRFSTNEKRRIGINPGADKPNKRWEPERYALLADRLIGRYGAEIIVLGGPGEETLSDDIQKKCDMMPSTCAGS